MRITILVIFFILSRFTVNAQSLEQQFESLKENSENYKVYKVIKRTELESFWSVVNDSINNTKDKLTVTNQKINSQQAEISELNSKIEGQKEEIDGLQHATSHIEVMGMDFSKEGYSIANFTIIIILIAGLGLLYYKYTHNHKVAKSKVLAFQKLDSEFEEYKKNSLEKQMKLRRELQTERNRIDEIRST